MVGNVCSSFYILGKQVFCKIIGLFYIDRIKRNDILFIHILYAFCHNLILLITHNICKWFADSCQNIAFHTSSVSERICFSRIWIHYLFQPVLVLEKSCIIGFGNSLVCTWFYIHFLPRKLFKITF